MNKITFPRKEMRDRQPNKEEDGGGGVGGWEKGRRRGWREGVPAGLFVGQRFRDLQGLVLLCVCACVPVCLWEGRVIEPPFIQYLPTKPEQSCELCLPGTKCLSSSIFSFSLPLSPFLACSLSLLATRHHIKIQARSKSHTQTLTHTHTHTHSDTHRGNRPICIDDGLI